MDKGTGKSYSSSACDSAGDAEVFGEVSIAGFILNLLVLPSVGVVLTGGMVALLLGILSIPAANW